MLRMMLLSLVNITLLMMVKASANTIICFEINFFGKHNCEEATKVIYSKLITIYSKFYDDLFRVAQ